MFTSPAPSLQPRGLPGSWKEAAGGGRDAGDARAALGSGPHRAGSNTRSGREDDHGGRRGRQTLWADATDGISASGRQCRRQAQELGGFFLASKSFLISSSFLAKFGIFEKKKRLF